MVTVIFKFLTTVTNVWPYSAYGLKILLVLQMHSTASTVYVSVHTRLAVFIPILHLLSRAAHLCQQPVCFPVCKRKAIAPYYIFLTLLYIYFVCIAGT